MSQALSIGKELFEIQCSDFTSEEKTSADQTPDRHPICMVSPAQQRGQCFYSVSDFKKVSEFFRSHKTLLLCPFMGFYRYGNSADTFIDFRLALRFVWTVCTLFLLKGNMKLLGFITGISTGFLAHILQGHLTTLVPVSLNTKSARISSTGFPDKSVLIRRIFFWAARSWFSFPE